MTSGLYETEGWWGRGNGMSLCGSRWIYKIIVNKMDSIRNKFVGYIQKLACIESFGSIEDCENCYAKFGPKVNCDE